MESKVRETLYDEIFNKLFYKRTDIIRVGLDVTSFGIRIGYSLADGRSIVYGEIRLRRQKNFARRLLRRDPGKNGKLYLHRPEGSIKNIFVDNKRVKTRVRLKPTSTIEIGRYSVDLSGTINDQRHRQILTGNGIEVKWNDQHALHRMDVELAQGQIMVVMGPSGCGKSTLLKAVSGQITTSRGTVLISGHNIAEHYGQVKKMLGYVPQDDIVHKELTVEQAVYFACRLRGVRSRDIEALTNSILKKLNLLDKRHGVIENLSGGERKRVSVAVELVDQPEILLMDEPTSPLDPETTEEFMEQIRALVSESNTAILMVTHKPDDLRYADRVIFLAKGGYQVFNGSKEEFLDRISNKHFDIKAPTITSFYERFSDSRNGRLYHLPSRSGPGYESGSNKIKKKDHTFLSQLFWLSMRYFRIKFPTDHKDSRNERYGWRASLLNYTGQVLIIAIVMVFMYPQFNMGVLFVISISPLWFALSNSSKEIVGELAIYYRERMYNLNIHTYLLSKILVLVTIGIYQIVLLVTIVVLTYRYVWPSKIPTIYLRDPIGCVLYLVSVSASATALGLLISACWSKVEKVLIFVPIVLLPQIILSGIVAKLDTREKELVSYFALGRWSLEGLSLIQDGNSGPEGSLVIENRSVTEAPPTYSSSSAIDILGTYNDVLRNDGTHSWTFLKSINGNYLALLAHFLAAYVGCIIALLRKEPKRNGTK